MLDQEQTKEDLDSVWILICAFMVFFMQAGFAMLELGTVRVKNAINILIKNLLDVFMATIFWFVLGYGIAYGHNDGNLGIVFGLSNYAGGADQQQPRDWLFQWAFAGTAATIVSGCLAERCYLSAYVACSVALTGFIYPCVVHWTWATDGWLAALGQSDFAGSGVVHMLGGVCGIIGAAFLGARIGRFDPELANEFKPHNTGMVTLGTMILWFGWYGFNGGSALGASGELIQAIELVCMNTTLAGACSGLTVFAITIFLEGQESVTSLTNGLLAGLVGITAGCDAANSTFSIVIGVVSGLVYMGSVKLVAQLKVDDPLDAFSVHGACGLWGVIASGLVRVILHNAGWGVLLANLLGALVIITWTAFWSALIFAPLKYFDLLRVPREVEVQGLDRFQHGGLAYYFGNHEKEMREQEPGNV